VFSNLISGNDSLAAIRRKGNVFPEPLLRNGRLALAPLFRLSAVMAQYYLGIYKIRKRQSRTFGLMQNDNMSVATHLLLKLTM
jgi:hypothetical protein